MPVCLARAGLGVYFTIRKSVKYFAPDGIAESLSSLRKTLADETQNQIKANSAGDPQHRNSLDTHGTVPITRTSFGFVQVLSPYTLHPKL